MWFWWTDWWSICQRVVFVYSCMIATGNAAIVKFHILATWEIMDGLSSSESVDHYIDSFLHWRNTKRGQYIGLQCHLYFIYSSCVLTHWAQYCQSTFFSQFFYKILTYKNFLKLRVLKQILSYLIKIVFLIDKVCQWEFALIFHFKHPWQGSKF